IELIGKFRLKNKRNIRQIGLLVPLYSDYDKLFYIPIFGMLDNQHSKELNIGIGFRKIFNKKTIHGAYAFFDYRKTPSKNYFKQITIGYELFTKYFEARANIYLPENKSIYSYIPIKDSVDTNYNGNITKFNIDRTNNLYTEKASKGFDTEFGLTKGCFGIYLGYYRFINQENNTHGLRQRAMFRVLPWLTLEAEANYQNFKTINPYFGLKINLPFTKKYKSSIYSKMNYLPIRDVDIVSTKKFTPNVHTYHEKTVNGWAPMVDKNGKVGKNVYLNMAALTPEINAGKKYTDIGTIQENSLFTLMGEFAGEYVLIAPGSNEFDILTNIKTHVDGNEIVLTDARANSPLNKTIQKGFWTNQRELVETIQAINTIKDKYKDEFSNLSFSKEDVDQAIKEGTYMSTIVHALLWEYKDNNQVYVANFRGDTKKKSNAENIKKLTKALANRSNERFIVMNLYQTSHHIGVVVDTVKRDIIFAESNGRNTLTPEEKAVLDSQFNGYNFSSYTFAKQKERWSCGAHAFMNIVGLVNGHFAPGTPQTNRRHVGTVLERMHYQSYANMLFR
ncbi:MAG: inverse autotransporter beta domain-containing protein, partial [Legionellales bacterium]|nr:inverse autotransporter beta domain-containing protein [Legionellales bacterium]